MNGVAPQFAFGKSKQRLPGLVQVTVEGDKAVITTGNYFRHHHLKTEISHNLEVVHELFFIFSNEQFRCEVASEEVGM
jgi:hypothetical protein